MAANPPEKDTSVRLDDIHSAMSYPGVQVVVKWGDCGSPNAFYHPVSRHIHMCNELRQLPNGVTRFIFAHEMAHAIIWQRNIPYTVSEEATADELAAYALYLTGNQADIQAAADWFATKHVQGWRVHPMDDHPDHLKRAVTLMCLSLGYEGNAMGCPRNWMRFVTTWNRLLGTED